MKTLITCLAIIAISLLIGQKQSQLLSHLEMEAKRTKQPTLTLWRKPQTNSYFSPRERRKNITLEETLAQIVEINDAKDIWRSGQLSTLAEAEPEIYELLAALDFEELREIIPLLVNHPNRRFRHVAHESVHICLLCMSAFDPEQTLVVLNELATQTKPALEYLSISNAANYILTTWLRDDPEGALEASLDLQNLHGGTVTLEFQERTIWKLLPEKPELLLLHIDQLPPQIQKPVLVPWMPRFEDHVSLDPIMEALLQSPNLTEKTRLGIAENLLVSYSEYHATDTSSVTEWLRKFDIPRGQWPIIYQVAPFRSGADQSWRLWWRERMKSDPTASRILTQRIKKIAESSTEQAYVFSKLYNIEPIFLTTEQREAFRKKFPL